MSTRSEVRSAGPFRPGNGSSRYWSRTIQGKLYSFTAVLMPDGERRYVASRLDGPDGRYDCNWTHNVLKWVFPA